MKTCPGTPVSIDENPGQSTSHKSQNLSDLQKESVTKFVEF